MSDIWCLHTWGCCSFNYFIYYYYYYVNIYFEIVYKLHFYKKLKKKKPMGVNFTIVRVNLSYFFKHFSLFYFFNFI